MELFLRVAFSLAAVVGLMWVIARVASRRLEGTNAAVVRLVGRQSVGRTASVAVVSVGERLLVVGVTETGVRLLTELDGDELGPAVSPDDAAAVPRDPSADPRPGDTSPGLVPQGSVLSSQTWRQAWQAATSRSGTDKR